MTQIQDNRTVRVLPFILFALFIFAGLVIKANTTSFTHDESLSYIRFVFTGDPFSIGDTNNHLLNSILMYCSSLLFGVSEFSLRLPNLMAYLGYAFFTYKVLVGIKDFQVRLLGFFMLNAIPFILDFFALARGYGLALSLFLGHIYFLTRFLNAYKPKYLSYALLLISLASFAVMTMVYFVAFILAFGAYVVLSERLGQDKIGKKKIVRTLIISMGVLILIFGIGSSLKSQGSFFFGETSFLSSLRTLIGHMIYHYRYMTWPVVGALLFLLCLFLIHIYKQVKRKGLHQVISNPLGLYAALMFFCAVAMVGQHLVLDTFYPPARAIQFYIPLFLLMLIYWLDQVPKIPRRVVSVSLTILVSLNFVNGVNLEEALLWGYDADTKAHYQFIAEQREGKTTVVSHPLFRPTFNFYNIINQTNILAVQDASPGYFADYTINTDVTGYEDYKVITETSKSTLLKNNRVKREWDGSAQYEIADTSTQGFIDTDSEYLLLKKYNFPDTITQSAMVFVAFNASSSEGELLTAHVVVAGEGEDNNLYVPGMLSHHKAGAQEYRFEHGFWLSPEAMAGKIVNVYIWNLDKQELSIKDLQIKWYIPEVVH